MDRMLLSALVLWFVALTLLRVGPMVAPEAEAPAEREIRAAAFFPHDFHMEFLECKACHHRYEDGVNVVEEDELDGSDEMRCRYCHNDSASIEARQAFHRQCIECHRMYDKQEKASGPRTCGTCHPRQMPEEPYPLLIQ